MHSVLWSTFTDYAVKEIEFSLFANLSIASMTRLACFSEAFLLPETYCLNNPGFSLPSLASWLMFISGNRSNTCRRETDRRFFG